MLRVVSLLLSVIVVCGIAILIAGYVTPPQYKDSATFEVSFTTELTWGELMDIENSDKKKADVASVEIVDEYGKLVAWKENLKSGGYRIYRMVQVVENKRLVIELTESSYGLTGVWAFDLEKDPEGTKITITEESELTDIKVRGWRYFFGRNHDLLVWIKYIRVGLTDQLLTTL